ncbi:DUF3757 domain-containing protein [Pseudomonas sp. PWP3-1b2]|uniref:DUF3757 domain-containing protein n=1 Tax=Pseudomonas sp. PWP3-1b2 TaxID=2804656 RepID=UPI003CED7920
MISQLTCLCFLAGAGITQVYAEQSCPYPSSIKYVNGYFVANNGQSQWKSHEVDSPNFANSFIGALFTPSNGKERENGLLDRCVYRMGNGKTVALQYDRPGQPTTMSLTSSLHWELAVDPLKLDVYVCLDSQPDNCAFTVEI